MITLLYYIKKNTKYLAQSIKSILSQKNKNFDLIIFNPVNDESVNKILSNINIKGVNKFTYIKSNNEINKGQAYSLLKNKVDTKYIWFGDSTAILEDNFIQAFYDSFESCKNPDVISFSNTNVESNDKLFDLCDTYKKSDMSKLSNSILPYIDDKIFNVKFIKSEDIWFDSNKYKPILFLFKLLTKFETWTYINKKIITYVPWNDDGENIYDIFMMLDDVKIKYNQSNFWKSNKQFCEFLIIYYVIFVFIYKVFSAYKNDIIKDNAITYSKKWIETNYSKWYDNKYFKTHKYIKDNKVSKLIKDFKFNYKNGEKIAQYLSYDANKK